MGQSQLVEVAVGVIFVWFLLSVVLSAINEGLALLFRVRAKHLWLAMGRIVRPVESKFALRFLDTVIRLPFKPSGLDQRPVAREESADPPATGIQARDPEQSQASLAAELQQLYDVASPMLTDVATVGRRSKLTAIPSNVFAEAVETLASRVHPADLVRAADELEWSPALRAVLLSKTQELAADQPIDVTAVSDMDLGDVSIADKHRLFLQAAKSLTPRDLVDYFKRNPALRSAITRAMDAADVGDRLTAARATVEQWYDREMDRLSALYRRQSRKVLLILSIPIVLFFQANTIGTVNALGRDAGLREALANAATATAESPSLDAAVANLCSPPTTSTTTTSTSSTAPTTVDSSPDPSVPETAQSVTSAPVATTGADSTSSSVDSSTTTTTSDAATEAVEQLRCVGGIVQSARSFGLTPPLDDLVHPSRWSWSGIWHWIIDDYGWLGRAITVIALMFGAQFWFDILRRLVGIRSKISGAESASG